MRSLSLINPTPPDDYSCTGPLSIAGGSWIYIYIYLMIWRLFAMIVWCCFLKCRRVQIVDHFLILLIHGTKNWIRVRMRSSQKVWLKRLLGNPLSSRRKSLATFLMHYPPIGTCWYYALFSEATPLFVVVDTIHSAHIPTVQFVIVDLYVINQMPTNI